MSKFVFLLDVPGLCYGPVGDNLGAVYHSHVDGMQLYEKFLDC